MGQAQSFTSTCSEYPRWLKGTAIAFPTLQGLLVARGAQVDVSEAVDVECRIWTLQSQQYQLLETILPQEVGGINVRI
jgi:hypothetical protein